MHAHALQDMPVLLSKATYSRFLDDYQMTFGRILIDSGAFSELNSGVKIDIQEYKEWSTRWLEHADAIAGLDDISGDWKRSLKNYEEIPWSFPTIHEADPPELLDDLIAMSRERNKWLGIGLTPPRHSKEKIVRGFCDRIPSDIHVHGWALRGYTHIRKLCSVDSTNWVLDSMKMTRDFPWLTPAEAVDLVVKRYKRWNRIIKNEPVGLFNAEEAL